MVVLIKGGWSAVQMGALVCSKKAISQLKLGTFVGKYSLYLLKICNVKEGSL